MTQTTEPFIKRVIIESPYAGDVERNLRYVRAIMRDCLLRGEAPFASHLFYTQGVLDDNIPHERELGMRAGWAWLEVAHEIAVYEDLGISPGMDAAIKHFLSLGRGQPVVMRRLPGILLP